MENIYEYEQHHTPERLSLIFEVWGPNVDGEIGFFIARDQDCVSFFMSAQDVGDLHRSLGEALGVRNA